MRPTVSRSRRASTRNLSALPPPARMKQICKALALLDATYDESLRVYTYDIYPRGELASMQSHGGDMFSIWFDEHGAVIRGFELHSALGHVDRRPGHADLFDCLPEKLAPAAHGELASGGDDLTFVLWFDDGRWRTGRLRFGADEEDDPDGSETCLWMLADDPVTFFDYIKEARPARDGHGADVTAMFEMQPLTAERITRLNPDVDVETLLALAQKLGWPTRSTDRG